MGHGSSKNQQLNCYSNQESPTQPTPPVRFSYDQNQPDIDYYVIRLTAEQSVGLYGFMLAKTTLTWRDTLQNDPITLSACITSGIASSKLNRMQPDIKEWIYNGKATLDD